MVSPDPLLESSPMTQCTAAAPADQNPEPRRRLDALARRLARGLDRLAEELMRDVYENALVPESESAAVAQAMWQRVSATSRLPESVVGELWLAALECATDSAGAFGRLCCAAGAARCEGTPWETFRASVACLKDADRDDPPVPVN